MARDFTRYRRLLTSPHWQTEAANLPVAIAQWLLHSTSLTEKMQAICDCLQVEVISEGWQISTDEEKQWVREVILKCGTRDWIFAQTRLAESTIRNVAQSVPTLGDYPIGLWLFPQQPTRLSLTWQKDLESGLYARCSKLTLHSYPIEIKELFLEDFPFETSYATNNSAL